MNLIRAQRIAAIYERLMWDIIPQIQGTGDYKGRTPDSVTIENGEVIAHWSEYDRCSGYTSHDTSTHSLSSFFKE